MAYCNRALPITIKITDENNTNLLSQCHVMCGTHLVMDIIGSEASLGNPGLDIHAIAIIGPVLVKDHLDIICVRDGKRERERETILIMTYKCFKRRLLLWLTLLDFVTEKENVIATLDTTTGLIQATDLESAS